MKVLGLFRELGLNIAPSVASIHASAGALASDVAVTVAEYLTSGVPIFDVMEATVDPFDGEVRIAGGPSLVSDGEWVWRSDLPYFVKKYRVALPNEFIGHALGRKSVTGDRGAILRNWQEALDSYERAEQGLIA